MKSTEKKRVGIGLLGKGSTNHLHRAEVVKAFDDRGFQVTFIVREDYGALLTKLKGCRYVTCKIREENGWRAIFVRFFQDIRFAYPSSDAGHRRFLFKRYFNSLRPWVVIRNLICFGAARFRECVAFAALCENRLGRADLVDDLDPREYDILLLLGIGTVDSELEGAITRWSEHHGILQVHIVGNYDHLTSKGFRGILPEKLLVWGPQMLEDATKFHGMPTRNIHMIGSIRYNSIDWKSIPDRNTFFANIGLDPEKKTIVFAGFVFVSQYFEIMEIYRQLQERANNHYQLVVRLYPNKSLMNSIYVEPLLSYAKTLPSTYVSCADPHFKHGDRNKEVLQVEEDELWPLLYHCDVLVDYYSTIALECAIFDKPCIHMHYVPKTPGAFDRVPSPIKFWELRHNKRLLNYGAIEVAYSREELVEMIQRGIFKPEQFAEERMAMVERECGPLDGLACDRLISECEALLAAKNN